MQTTQVFIATPPLAPPVRWREAFPAGQVQVVSQVTALTPATAVWLTAGDANWPTHLRDIKALQSHAAVVLLSDAPTVDEGLRALDAGMQGYVHAYAVPTLLQEVALVVAHGGLWVGPELLGRLIASTHQALTQRANRSTSSSTTNPWAQLSPREIQVANLVCEGKSNKEIANLLFISERTVKAHLGQMFEKVAVRDRLQLVLRLAAATASDQLPTTPPAQPS